MANTDLTRALSLSCAAGLALLVGCEAPLSNQGMDSGGYHPQASQSTGESRSTSGQSRTASTQGQNRGRVFGMSEMAFPTGEDRTSLVRVSSSSTQEQVRVGRPYIYTFNVTNLSDEITLENVTVHQELPGSMQVAGVSPEGLAQGERAGEWRIGSLSPGETKEIEVSLVPQEEGRFESCVRVTYNPVLCTVIDVVAPNLELVKEAPATALLCEPVPVRYVVTNSGSGRTEDVVIRDQLPEGVMGPDGTGLIEIPVGALNAGQSKQFTVNLRADRAGELTTQAMAVAADGLEARSEPRPTLIWSPNLDVRITGPENEYINTPLEFVATVTNRGSGPPVDAHLNLDFDPRVQIISTTLPIDRQNRTIAIGELAPGQSREIGIVLQTTQPGQVAVRASASAPCTKTPAAEAFAVVQGISSLLLEVVDNFDPVKVGEREIYQIMVVNQGAAADSNIQILAEIPPGMEFVGVEGPTQARVENNQLTFAPIATLAPGERVVWNVTVIARERGDLRFKTQLTSDTLTAPVIETEATRLY